MRGTLSLVAVVLLLAGIVGGAGTGAPTTLARMADVARAWDDPDPVVRIERSGDGGVRVRVTSGTADLDDVAAALVRARQPRVLTGRRGAWELTAGVAVDRGATLLVRDSALRLVGNVGLHAAGGRLVLRRAAVTGWDAQAHTADTVLSDGRGWILASRRGAISAVDTRLANLGYDAPGRWGVTAAGATSRLRLTAGAVRSGFDGVHLADGASARITATQVVGARRHGVADLGGRDVTVNDANIVGSAAHGVLVERAMATRVLHSTVHANHGGGIVVRAGSRRADIADNNVFHNPSAGVLVDDAGEVDVRDNLVHSSTVGVAVRGDAAKVGIDNNRVASNRTDGIWIGERARTVTVTGNRIDFNNEAAIAVKNGATRVRGNLLTQNFDGVRLETPAGTRVRGDVRGNAITANVQDGVDLPAGASLPVAGNTITGNREGGVSVVARGDGTTTIARNRVDGNGRGDERVRESTTTPGDL